MSIEIEHIKSGRAVGNRPEQAKLNHQPLEFLCVGFDFEYLFPG